MNQSNASSGPPTVTRRHWLASAAVLAVLAPIHSCLAHELVHGASLTGRNGIMKIDRNGSRPSGKGPEAWFTGTVRVDPLFQAGYPVRVSGGQGTGEAGAWTMWHTH